MTANRPRNGLGQPPRLRPRWHKVLADLWSNKVRTLLVVASIGVGLFAVGMIATLHGILTTDMRDGYAQINPANITIFSSGFDQEIVDQVGGVRGVALAEGLRSFDVMVRTGPDTWARMGVEASDDLPERQISRLALEAGDWPVNEREIVLERNKLEQVVLQGGQAPLGLGGTLEVKLPSGKIRELRLVGVVHDLTLGASGPGGFFLAPIQGYLQSDNLAWLEQPEDFNKLQVTVQADTPALREDESYLREIANRVSQSIEDNHGLVYNAQVRGSRDHPNAAYVDAMSGVLFLLGALVVFLSSFLITNTLSALLNQQAQQIAIMKTVGARSAQVTVMYMALIFVFSALALAIALPLSRQGAFALLEFLSTRINFSVLSYRSVPLAVILQAAIALVVPQVAGLAPILRGSRVKVQDVISGSLREDAPHPKNRLERWFEGSPARGKRRFSRPLLISLRNTFRHRGRLVLTLITLTLGGAVFIATFNVQASLENYIQRIGRYFMADVNLTMDQSYRIATIEEALRDIPGVERAEGLAYGRSELLLENPQTGRMQTGDAVQLMGPPADSELMDPILLQGRWVTPGERQAIVLSERFLSRYPEMGLGDTLQLRVDGKETEWQVIGFFQLAGKSSGFVAYTDYTYLAQLTGQTRRAVTFRIIATRPAGRALTLAEQEDLGARVEAVLQQRGYGVVEVSAGRSLVENTIRPLSTLTTFLLIMALLTAIVGSIGLMGTMSMNVLDRTREIGVMRAIGASDRSVMSLVMVEGVLIGLISWVLGTLLAVPISKLLSDTIHLAVFDATADFAFTLTGPLYWLALVIVLSILASVLPARSAAHLTIREALAYE